MEWTLVDLCWKLNYYQLLSGHLRKKEKQESRPISKTDISAIIFLKCVK